MLLWGHLISYVKYRHTLEFVSFITWNYLRHAEDGLGFVGGKRYNTLIQTNERHDMSNTIKVPHTVTFLAEINIDTIPANLIPALLNLSESELRDMVKATTVHALNATQFADKVNEGGSWATVSIAE